MKEKLKRIIERIYIEIFITKAGIEIKRELARIERIQKKSAINKGKGR